MSQFGKPLPGSMDPASALEDLLSAVRQSIASYRLAESCADDHRVQAAIQQIRLDHERHLQELTELWLEATQDAGVLVDAGAPAGERRVPAAPPSTPLADMIGPVADALRHGNFTSAAMLAAVQSEEAALHELYDHHVGRGYMEPLRAVLARHRREEEAHLSFMRESETLRSLASEPTLRGPRLYDPTPDGARRRPDRLRQHRSVRPPRRNGDNSLPDRRLAGMG